MALFENYERRVDKINSVLKEYGISSIEECKDITLAKGIDCDKIVRETQPICFENACLGRTRSVVLSPSRRAAPRLLTLLPQSVKACRLSVFRVRLPTTAKLVSATETSARCFFRKKPMLLASLPVMNPLLLLRVLSRSRSTQTRFA